MPHKIYFRDGKFRSPPKKTADKPPSSEPSTPEQAPFAPSRSFADLFLNAYTINFNHHQQGNPLSGEAEYQEPEFETLNPLTRVPSRRQLDANPLKSNAIVTPSTGSATANEPRTALVSASLQETLDRNSSSQKIDPESSVPNPPDRAPPNHQRLTIPPKSSASARISTECATANESPTDLANEKEDVSLHTLAARMEISTEKATTDESHEMTSWNAHHVPDKIAKAIEQMRRKSCPYLPHTSSSLSLPPENSADLSSPPEKAGPFSDVHSPAMAQLSLLHQQSLNLLSSNHGMENESNILIDGEGVNGLTDTQPMTPQLSNSTLATAPSNTSNGRSGRRSSEPKINYNSVDNRGHVRLDGPYNRPPHIRRNLRPRPVEPLPAETDAVEGEENGGVLVAPMSMSVLNSPLTVSPPGEETEQSHSGTPMMEINHSRRSSSRYSRLLSRVDPDEETDSGDPPSYDSATGPIDITNQKDGSDKHNEEDWPEVDLDEDNIGHGKSTPWLDAYRRSNSRRQEKQPDYQQTCIWVDKSSSSSTGSRSQPSPINESDPNSSPPQDDDADELYDHSPVIQGRSPTLIDADVQYHAWNRDDQNGGPSTQHVEWSYAHQQPIDWANVDIYGVSPDVGSPPSSPRISHASLPGEVSIPPLGVGSLDIDMFDCVPPPSPQLATIPIPPRDSRRRYHRLSRSVSPSPSRSLPSDAHNHTHSHSHPSPSPPPSPPSKEIQIHPSPHIHTPTPLSPASRRQENLTDNFITAEHPDYPPLAGGEPVARQPFPPMLFTREWRLRNGEGVESGERGRERESDRVEMEMQMVKDERERPVSIRGLQRALDRGGCYPM